MSENRVCQDGGGGGRCFCQKIEDNGAGRWVSRSQRRLYLCEIISTTPLLEAFIQPTNSHIFVVRARREPGLTVFLRSLITA